MCDTIRRMLKTCNAKKETQIKCFKTIAALKISYRIETCFLKQKDENRIHTTEMRFLRGVKEYTRIDFIQNDNIRKEINCKTKWTKIGRIGMSM